MNKKSPPKMLAVEWMDHHTDGGWKTEEQCLESMRRPLICRTVGFLVSEDRRTLSLAQSCTQETGRYGELINILKSTIVRRRTIRASSRR